MAAEQSDTRGDFHSIGQDARLANPPQRFRDLHASQNRETEESGHQESGEGEEEMKYHGITDDSAADHRRSNASSIGERICGHHRHRIPI